LKIQKMEKKMKKIFFIVLFACIFFIGQFAEADDVVWSGGGDATSWTDDNNWFPVGEPTSVDDVTIDTENAAVVCDETFVSKSLTAGAHQTSQITVQEYVYGTIIPSSPENIAIANYGGGTIIFQGSAGTIRVGGRYEDSESTFAAEPSFLFWAG